MSTKNIKGVIIPRHDTARNWANATNFIPRKGELIVYDADPEGTTYDITTVTIGGKTYPVEPSTKVRFKFGDGELDAETGKVEGTNVNALPFATTDAEGYATEEWVKTYVAQYGGGGSLAIERRIAQGTEVTLTDVYYIQSNIVLKTLDSTGNDAPNIPVEIYGESGNLIATETSDASGIISSDNIQYPYTKLKVTDTDYEVYAEYDATLYTNVDGSQLVGEKTSEGGEIFNDYTANKAISEFSTAIGSENMAGCRGIRIIRTVFDANEQIVVYVDSSSIASMDITDIFKADDKIILRNNYDYYYGTIISANTLLDSNDYYDFDTEKTSPVPSSSVVIKLNTSFRTLADSISTQKDSSDYLDDNYIINLNYIGNEGIELGTTSYAEGLANKALGDGSHVEGAGCIAAGRYSHAEGRITKTLADWSHAEGLGSAATANYSHAEGYYSESAGKHSHSEGAYTKAKGSCSHSEGQNTIASGNWSHAEGYGTDAVAKYSHAEGMSDDPNGGAHGEKSHVEGYNTSTGENAVGAHAEGVATKANAHSSHAGGYHSTANGNASTAQGNRALTNSMGSNAFGVRVLTSENQIGQTVVGVANEQDDESMFVVGGGNVDVDDDNLATEVKSRKNLLMSRTDGRLTIAKNPTDDMDVVTKQYFNNNIGTKTQTKLDDISTKTQTAIEKVEINSASMPYQNASSVLISEGLAGADITSITVDNIIERSTQKVTVISTNKRDDFQLNSCGFMYDTTPINIDDTTNLYDNTQLTKFSGVKYDASTETYTIPGSTLNSMRDVSLIEEASIEADASYLILFTAKNNNNNNNDSRCLRVNVTYVDGTTVRLEVNTNSYKNYWLKTEANVKTIKFSVFNGHETCIKGGIKIFKCPETIKYSKVESDGTNDIILNNASMLNIMTFDDMDIECSYPVDTMKYVDNSIETFLSKYIVCSTVPFEDAIIDDNCKIYIQYEE